jgi:hypothetical protein
MMYVDPGTVEQIMLNLMTVVDERGQLYRVIEPVYHLRVGVSTNYVRDDVGLLKLGERGIVSTVWGPYFSWFDIEQYRNPQAGYLELHLSFNRGRVDQVGTLDEILDQPATPFIAGFVGEAVRLPIDAAGRSIQLGPHSILTTDDTISGAAELFVRPRDSARPTARRMRSRPAWSRCAARAPRAALPR